MLEILFLGKVQFNRDGENLKGEINNKAAAIIALLMASTKKEMSREKIISYLWPDSTIEAAKYNLRYNLWVLKKLIGKDEKGNELLVVTRDHCAINQEYDYFCDVSALNELVINEKQKLSELQKGLELFGGDFFEGCYFSGCSEFNEHIIFQRTILEKKKLDLIGLLGKMNFAINNIKETIVLMEKSMRIDPYNEGCAALLIDAYIKAGEKAKAVKVYHNIVANLSCDLSIGPSDLLKAKLAEINEIDDSEINGQQIKGLSDKPYLKIECRGIPSVEGFLIGSILGELEESMVLEIEDFVSPDEKKELGYFQCKLGKCPGNTSIARQLQLFTKLLNGILEEFDLHIDITDKNEIDNLSKVALSLISNNAG
ncbi:MAG: BTAD domain-containing putative transcriptional regulator [Anaerovoracaceae bacterium]